MLRRARRACSRPGGAPPQRTRSHHRSPGPAVDLRFTCDRCVAARGSSSQGRCSPSGYSRCALCVRAPATVPPHKPAWYRRSHRRRALTLLRLCTFAPRGAAIQDLDHVGGVGRRGARGTSRRSAVLKRTRTRRDAAGAADAGRRPRRALPRQGRVRHAAGARVVADRAQRAPGRRAARGRVGGAEETVARRPVCGRQKSECGQNPECLLHKVSFARALGRVWRMGGRARTPGTEGQARVGGRPWSEIHGVADPEFPTNPRIPESRISRVTAGARCLLHASGFLLVLSLLLPGDAPGARGASNARVAVCVSERGPRIIPESQNPRIQNLPRYCWRALLRCLLRACGFVLLPRGVPKKRGAKQRTQRRACKGRGEGRSRPGICLVLGECTRT